jgi:ATP-dependent DNA ligase
MQLPVMPPLAPMLAKAVSTLPDGPVIFEPKWDGFRSIIFRDGDEVEIGSRNGKPMTRYFPELVEALKANLPSRCVLDGEIILVGSGGDRLDFDALQQRIYPAASRVKLLAVQTPASFVAFDLLALDDEDLTGRPCHERRTVLEEVLARCAAPVHVTAATRDRTTAQRWFDQFEGAGLDGIVARPVDGRYLPDKRSMFKIKDERTADCVLAGYRLHTSGLGRIGSPLRPERVVEVKYDHMEGERFRHTAQFVRWRPDREPRSCTFEQLEQPVEFDLAAVLGSGGD